MNLDKRLRDLEGDNVSAWRPMSDEVVLEAVRQGVADDRHVDWLDGLLRSSILSNLCLAGLVLRVPRCAESIDTSGWAFAVHLGMLVMAQPAGEPIHPRVATEVNSGPFITSIPDSDAAERVHRRSGDPRFSSVFWIRARLVARALGPDLGRGFRAGLDDVHARDDVGKFPVDLGLPHPGLYERLLVINEALALPGDAPLLMDDDCWRGIDDVVKRPETSRR